MQGKYKIITLCGSAKHKEEYKKAYNMLTVDGYIVMSIAHADVSEVYTKMELFDVVQARRRIENMYKQKIDMSDELYVINVDGNIDEDMKLQIAYALEHGKPVRYLEKDDKTDQENEKFVPVENLPISVRLCHILTRNKVDYLYQVGYYCEEQLLKFRNMGKGTMDELRDICERHGMYIYSYRDLSIEEIGVSFTQSAYEKIFNSGIRGIEDVVNSSSVELARLFGNHSVTYKKMIQIKNYEEQRKKENVLA